MEDGGVFSGIYPRSVPSLCVLVRRLCPVAFGAFRVLTALAFSQLSEEAGRR